MRALMVLRYLEGQHASAVDSARTDADLLRRAVLLGPDNHGVER